MSVSSHLTPEPERRLWIILESLRQTLESTDHKIAALTVFAAVELAFFKVFVPAGVLGTALLLPLAAALPLGVLAFSPVAYRARRFALISDNADNREDSLITPAGLARFSENELIHKLDKYLGGGITATQYYEDLVGQILGTARIAVRKQKFFQILGWLVGLGQLGLLVRLFFSF